MKIEYTPYERKGMSYQCSIRYEYNGLKGEIKSKLGVVTYHLVKKIHGEGIFEHIIAQRIEALKTELMLSHHFSTFEQD